MSFVGNDPVDSADALGNKAYAFSPPGDEGTDTTKKSVSEIKEKMSANLDQVQRPRGQGATNNRD